MTLFLGNAPLISIAAVIVDGNGSFTGQHNRKFTCAALLPRQCGTTVSEIINDGGDMDHNVSFDGEFLYQALREIIDRIELCGASIELTNAVALASDLCAAIGNEHNPPNKQAADRVRNELAISRLIKHKNKCAEKSKRIYG